VPLIFIALLFFGGIVFSMPLLLVLRYRAGTMRRRGRRLARVVGTRSRLLDLARDAVIRLVPGRALASAMLRP